MSKAIYFVTQSGDFEELVAAAFGNEATFQELLCQHPKFLGEETSKSDEARRWVLVKREIGIAHGDPSDQPNDRWSLDHLFLDQDGVPTLVEVKRAGDTRLRREVVGQMLDYAANSVVHWPVVRIREAFEQTCEDAARDPADVLSLLLNDDSTVEDYWERVESNLLAERIRLIFVADHIPSELKRIVEFLNGQMDPAEVFAVELRNFEGNGLRAMVPTVIGRTSRVEQKAKAKAGTYNPGRWGEEEILELIGNDSGDDVREAVLDLLEWLRPRTRSVHRGGGPKRPSFAPEIQIEGIGKVRLMHFSANGEVRLRLGDLRVGTGRIDLPLQTLYGRIDELLKGGVGRPLEEITSHQHIKVKESGLTDPETRKSFKDAFEEFFRAVESGPSD